MVTYSELFQLCLVLIRLCQSDYSDLQKENDRPLPRNAVNFFWILSQANRLSTAPFLLLLQLILPALSSPAPKRPHGRLFHFVVPKIAQIQKEDRRQNSGYKFFSNRSSSKGSFESPCMASSTLIAFCFCLFRQYRLNSRFALFRNRCPLGIIPPP